MLLAVNYHYIRRDFQAPHPAIFGISPEQFENQLKTLGSFGEFVSARQIQEHITKGVELPEKSIIITFDDGLKEQYELAAPILKELGIPAIFFINTKTLEEPYLLNVHLIHIVRSLVSPSIILNQMMETSTMKSIGNEERLEMERKGIDHYIYDSEENAILKYLLNFVLPAEVVQNEFEVLLDRNCSKSRAELAKELYMTSDMIADLAQEEWIGSHSHYHSPLGTLNINDAEAQILKSKNYLKEICGYSPYAFSYPYGSEEAVGESWKLLLKHGFSFAFTMKRQLNSNLNNPLKLNRFDNNDVMGGKSFKPELLRSFTNVEA